MAPGSIIDQIFESIAKSGLVVADLSGRNQNVMYEVGLATAMGKEMLLLAQAIDELPFDLRHRRVIVYRSSRDLHRSLLEAFAQFKRGISNGS